MLLNVNLKLFLVLIIFLVNFLGCVELYFLLILYLLGLYLIVLVFVFKLLNKNGVSDDVELFVLFKIIFKFLKLIFIVDFK